MGEKFEFRAKTAEGREVGGIREANDRFALARDLRAEDLVLVTARAVKGEAAVGGISSCHF